jgi:hypothetical protein
MIDFLYLPDIKCASTSNNMMFCIQTTFSFIFSFHCFWNIKRFLLIITISIINCQSISKIFDYCFSSQLNKNLKESFYTFVCLTRMTSLRIFPNGFPMILIFFIFLFNAIFDGKLNDKLRKTKESKV